MPSSTAQFSANGFVDSLGVNIHARYWDTEYGLPDHTGADVAKIERSLQYVGINSVRDGILYSWEITPLAQLAHDGYKLDLSYFVGNGGQTLAQQVAQWASLAPYLNSVEGPNESDNWSVSYGNVSGLAATRLVQAELYNLVRSTPALNGIPIIETSLGNSSSYAQLTGLGYADYGNTHSYFFDYDRPIFSQIPARIAEEGIVAPGLPTIATEAGFQTAPGGTDWSIVDQVTQAKLTLDLVLDQYQAGVVKTYLYQLLDINGDYYGLFNQDGSPKPVATALHNLTSILYDPGTGSATGTDLTYTMSNLLPTMQTMLFYKSTGTVDIALWNEAPIWNRDTKTSLSVSPAAETIRFGSVQSVVRLYDPLVQSTALQTWTDVDTISIGVPDHPVFIEIGAESRPPPAGLTTSVAQTAGSSTTIYRFFDKLTGSHFFTSSAAEAAGLQTPGSSTYRADLVLEKSAFSTLSAAAAASDPNAMSIGRLFDSSNGMHFYTASSAEIADLTTPGSALYRPDLVDEPGNVFYAHGTAQAGDVAVYRFFDTNNGSHFFSGNGSEAQAIATVGAPGYRPDLIPEGIAFYAPANT